LRLESKPVLLGAYGLAVAMFVAVVVLLFQTNPQVAQTGVRPADHVAAQLQSRLQDKRTKIALIYQTRTFAPIWFGADGRLTADARETMTILAAAGEEGLPADRYRLPAPPAPNAGNEARAGFELRMTGAVLSYAEDMRWGATQPAKLYDDVSQPREQDDIAGRLLAAAQSGTVATTLRALAPQVREYALLKAALKKYRATKPWPVVMAGSSPENLRQLQSRLQAEGFLPPGEAPVFAAALRTALTTYQTDSGLTGDGKLTDRTAAMLNIPAATRANQIAANMERWRWLPRDLGQQYIMVNVPDASLAVVEAGTPTLLSRVVVGAPDKPTPILTTKAVAVTVNPAWHVPKSIVQKEIQPKLEKNPNYLEEKNMVWRDGDVIQQPGPDNALGTAKFEMPNPFDVYMHDTPSKHAFLSDDRAVSHGCVRVEAIHELVEKMARIEHGKLEELIAAGQTVRKPLAQAVPVYIQYWTVIARENRGPVFREDVYGRDARMISAMFPKETAVVIAASR
jgi:L,D-transpeptidase YcbB